MIVPDYTLLIGVDARHLRQLSWVWPTWVKYKPSLLDRDVVAFYDHMQVAEEDVRSVLQLPSSAQRARLRIYPWPLPGIEHRGTVGDKWHDPQRYKMLAGFVHVAADVVNTPYFLKLDTDVVATGQDDWIDPDWFRNDPAIISHRWTFTKPPDQMDRLDRWAEINRDVLPRFPVGLLNLHPKPEASRLGHERIISFVGFFDTEFTRQCATAASITCGPYQLPEPSQDGYTFYMAKRLDRLIVRANMRDRGFKQWSTDRNVQKYAEEALDHGIADAQA